MVDSSGSPGDPPDLDVLARRVGRVVHLHRTAQGLSLGALARAAGLSTTIVSRIESGHGNPSMETLWRLSRALGVPLGALLAEEETPSVRRIDARSGERMLADSGMTGWLVHAKSAPHRSEAYWCDVPRGTDQASVAHLPGSEEVLLCLSGRLLVGPPGEEQELAPGDAVWFAADVPHRYHALEDSTALSWVLYPPPAGTTT
ncbi:helix-turn-helix domain-containing protein [Conexibacter sp. W3-3-2]|uniref:helix-turn-helix domain-containing protein n=1 Tax=Conexibacter sp. W3-3-2 TaxID=2675227 RepID=UPI0012B6B1C0|nr:helix-turn-helix domain-containing protein [Conexibacter sp. W3-3-2]MTD44094.1 helix-turn-helix domain-containing protein [Conexibacter sp. W3-3-2]